MKNPKKVEMGRISANKRWSTAPSPEQRFWSKVQQVGQDECWNWKGYVGISNGYGKTSFNNVRGTAHRFAYQIAKGEIPKGLCVLHRCDNKICCNPAHLFIGTLADNVADMVSKNRQHRPDGDKHHNRKLSEAIVREIRTQHSKGNISMRQIAIAKGVYPSVIQNIIHRKSWRCVA